MKKAYVTDKCLGDPICWARLRCPVKAIKKTNTRTKVPLWFFTRSAVDLNTCIGCGQCIKICPHHAIVLQSSQREIPDKRCNVQV